MRLAAKIWIWLLLGCPLLAQNTVLTGSFVFPKGDTPTGYIRLSIAKTQVLNICVVPAQNTTVQPVNITVTAGAVGSNTLLSQDCMSPRLPYLMQLYDSKGSLLYTDNWYIPNKNGGTLGIGLLSATALSASGITVAVPQPIVSVPVGNQTITQPTNTALSVNTLIVTGTLTLTGYLGPAVAPVGACTTNGMWEFSRDGHATVCLSLTWVTKI